MLAVVEQQIVVTPTDLAQGAVNDHVGSAGLGMSNDVQRIGSGLSQEADGRLPNLERTRCAARPGNVISGRKVHDRSVAHVDAVVLKRDASVAAPDEEVITAGQERFLGDEVGLFVERLESLGTGDQ